MELQPDGHPVSCVRFAPAAAQLLATAVAATVNGLYLLDLQSSPAGISLVLKRIKKTSPSDLPTGWKRAGRGRLNLSLSICHLFNPPDICSQT